MDETLLESISELKRRLEDNIAELRDNPKMAEVLKVHKALNTLEDLVGESKTSLPEAFGLSEADEEFKIRPDEYHGLSPLEAAKRYLRKRGQARQFDEIVLAIQSGGCRVESEEDLHLSLSRSTMEVSKVGPDLYGLTEFYPHLKRGKPGRKRKSINNRDAEKAETNNQIEEPKE